MRKRRVYLMRSYLLFGGERRWIEYLAPEDGKCVIVGELPKIKRKHWAGFSDATRRRITEWLNGGRPEDS